VHANATPGRAEAALLEQEKGAENAHSLLSAEPLKNFGIERYKIEDYADCVGNEGCYWADLDAQYRRAEMALKDEIARHRGIEGREEKLAVVMDIDETTLSGYCEMRREDFGYVDSMWSEWVKTPQAGIAIPGALRFYKEARAAGVAVFFITGRRGASERKTAGPDKDETAVTARSLEAAGFQGWAGLRLRNGEEIGMHTIEYKSRERKKIETKGYTILMSVGDQWSDLLGEPQAEVNVKLPNPFYFLP
jgi:predicted secreted acid phosphatase